jgi:SAM-dependent methyltransferase
MATSPIACTMPSIGPSAGDCLSVSPPEDEWDAWAATYERTAGLFTRINEPLIVRAVSPRGKRILDVGCGTGRLARLLGEEAREVVGIDASLRMIEQARSSQPSTVRFEVRSLFDLDPSERFDAVVACYVLHHMDSREALAVLCRAVAPGGLLVILEPLRGRLLDRIAYLLLVWRRFGSRYLFEAMRAKFSSPEWRRHDLNERILPYAAFESLYAGLLPSAEIRRVNALFGLVVWRKGT